jgi:hypothetical protein
MRGSTIRILLSSTTVALILVQATSLAPDREAARPVPIPAPSEKLPVTAPLAGVYAALPKAAGRTTAIVDRCFTSNLDANVPPAPGKT